MKKYLYIAIAAATLASCSQDEVMDVAEKEAISFGNVYVGKSTRAVDPSYSSNTIKSFRLFGTVNNVNIYNNVLVENKKSADSNEEAGYGNEWYCPVTQYWISDADYKFVAIVDGGKSGVTNTTIEGGMPTSITYTADGITDLLCKTVTRKNDHSMVDFEFSHLLSKAKFTVDNTTPDATMYQHEIIGLKISNAYSANSYNVVNASWGTATPAVDGQSFDDIVVANTTEDTECANEKLLIPGLTSATVEFTHILYYLTKDDQGNDVKKEVKRTAYTGENALTAAITGGMKANYSYNFTFSVGVGQKITFTVSQPTEWTSGGDHPLTAQ